MDQELIPVTLWLAGRGYRIKIKKEDEQAIRLAAKTAEDKVNELRRTFAGKDDQDFLAMCLLLYAASSVTDKEEFNFSSKEKLSEMISQIDKVLEKQEKD